MKRLIALPVVAAAIVLQFLPTAASAQSAGTKGGAAPTSPHHGTPIPDQYIVTVKAGHDPLAVAASVARDPQAASIGVAPNAIHPDHVFTAALNGFSAKLTPGQLTALQHRPEVEAIEQDQVVTAETTEFMDSSDQPWGLDRIDQRFRPLSFSYSFNGRGAGVTAYIIDSGIQTSHPDFGGRALAVYDAFGGNGQDCDGHGTHVAGTVGGARYGVAKSVALRAVRVLRNCAGGPASGSFSGIIGGIDWVARNARHPAVANMSFQGGFSAAENLAVTNLVNSGVFVAVAAGNSSADACNFSPASAFGTYTVAASDAADTRASFSNYGACVDGYAPGVFIKSDWINTGTNIISGTSQATPHVTGVAALLKGDFGELSAATVINWLYTNATPGIVRSNPSGTRNLLLFKSAL